MKKIFANKKNTVILSVILAVVIAVSAIVIVSKRKNGPDKDVDAGTTTTTTQAAGDGTTTEKVTEESSETSSKTQEEDETKDNTETSTKKPETTTKKPNKTETTTKKPVTTTKPSKSEEEENREMMYGKYGGKEGYEAHLEEVRNYKCSTCGKHDCPSLEYGTDLLGNPGWPSIHPEKCPAIINGTAKCEHCGKTLVSPSDDRWLTQPEKYCSGNCHINFG